MTIENLQVASTSKHECELTVTVDKNFVAKEFINAVNKVQRVAARPGFRPGKMPKNMVMNFYGEEIKKKLVEKLIENSFEDACEEKDLTPVSKPQMELISEINQDKSFTYRAIFQVKPKIALPEYKGLNIELKEFIFDEKDIDDEINTLRENMATFIEPADRNEVQDNDLVLCSSIVQIDGKINEKYSNEDHSIPLFAKNTPPDLKAALIGKKIAESASVKYAMPTDHQDDNVRGKKCDMLITIKSIKEKFLPALDDNFAKDVSEKFQTIDDIRESIRIHLNTMAKRRNKHFRQDAIIKALIEKNPLDVPPALVEDIALSLINNELKTMGGKIADELVKNHWQELWDSVQTGAQIRAKVKLLFEVLIKELDIQALDEEIADKVKKMKSIDEDDARHSIQAEKLLAIIEKEALVSTVKEPLFEKSS
jgi:trigger factor